MQNRQKALFSATQTQKVCASCPYLNVLLLLYVQILTCIVLPVYLCFLVFFSCYIIIKSFYKNIQVEDLARLSYQTTPIYIDADDGQTKVEAVISHQFHLFDIFNLCNVWIWYIASCNISLVFLV